MAKMSGSRSTEMFSGRPSENDDPSFDVGMGYPSSRSEQSEWTTADMADFLKRTEKAEALARINALLDSCTPEQLENVERAVVRAIDISGNIPEVKRG